MVLILLIFVVALGITRPAIFTGFLRIARGLFIEIRTNVETYFPIWRLYTLVAIGVIAVLVVVGILVKVPAITGICFLLAVVLFYAVWLVPGAALRLLSFIPGVNITDRVFPSYIVAAAAWLAFFGFLGMVYPDALSMNLFIGMSLLGFLSLAMASKFDLLNVVVGPLVTVICALLIWKFIAPEGFRTTARNFASKGEVVNAWQDRSSVESEAEAAFTFAKVKRPVKIMYEFTLSSSDGEDTIQALAGTHFVSIKADSVLRLVNRKQKVQNFDGMGFVEVQLPNSAGTFIGGQKFWIEANFVQIMSPSDLTRETELKERDRRNEIASHSYNQNESKSHSSPSSKSGSQKNSSRSESFYNSVGSYNLAINKDEESSWIKIGPCHVYNFDNDNIEVVSESGRHWKVWQIKKLPDLVRLKVINRSSDPVNLLIRL